MTWRARSRLALGLIAVLALTGWMTIHLNASRGVVSSVSASIEVDTYDVGSAYAGLVVKQDVAVGDAVKKGDPLFVIDSAGLRHDVRVGLVDPDTSAVSIDKDGLLTVTATGPGIVSQLDAARGTFVQASARLAQVEKDDTLHVRAEYLLSPEQLVRMQDAGPVTLALPDGADLDGVARRTTIRTEQGQTRAVVLVDSVALERGADGGLIVPGTPVTATLHLRNDGWMTDVATAVSAGVDRARDWVS